LLGVPSIAHKSNLSAGELISTAITNLLSKWNCTESVAGMVFDTTSSNTGNSRIVDHTLELCIN